MSTSYTRLTSTLAKQSRLLPLLYLTLFVILSFGFLSTLASHLGTSTLDLLPSRPAYFAPARGAAQLDPAQAKTLQGAIVAVAQSSEARLSELNKGWDDEKERREGRFDLRSLELDEYRAEMRAGWDRWMVPAWESIQAQQADESTSTLPTSSILASVLARLSLSVSPAKLIAPPLPKTIWNIAPSSEPDPPQFKHWAGLNPAWTVEKLDDAGMDRWVANTFGTAPIVQAFDRLPLKIHQTDILRYLLLLMEGGVYADHDTAPVKVIEEWEKGAVDKTDLSLRSQQEHLRSLWQLFTPAATAEEQEKGETEAVERMEANKELGPPALIVSVEKASTGGVGDKPKPEWVATGFSRRIQIVQWSLAAPPGHPVLLDAVSRILSTSKRVESGDLKLDSLTVLDFSGPGVFSDCVLRYLKARWGFDIEQLQEANLRRPIRVGDVLILPELSMQAAASEPEEYDVNDKYAVVWHGFAGSWKEGRPWRKRARARRGERSRRVEQ